MQWWNDGALRYRAGLTGDSVLCSSVNHPHGDML